MKLKTTAPALDLKLAPSGDSILLAAVDAAGNPIRGGEILFVLPSGKIQRIPNLSPSLGLSLDASGRIEIE